MAKTWKDFDTLPEDGQRIEVKFPRGTIIATVDSEWVAFPNDNYEIETMLSEGNKWRDAPDETESNEIERNDMKTIPNDELLTVLKSYLLSQYGTVANDMETNVDKIIVRYNAGKVTE